MGRRVLVIGAGWAARHIHLPRLLASGTAAELAVTDRDPVAASALAREFGIAHTCRPTAAADLVVITTPPASHAALATEALLLGSDVAVEKPLATTVADAVALHELALRQGRRLHVFHTPRYRADVRLLTDLVRSGRLGDVSHCSVRWLRRHGVPATVGTRADGLVWDLGAHLADLVVGLLPAGALSGTVVATGIRADIAPGDVAGWYPAGAGDYQPRRPELVDVRAAAVLTQGWTVTLHAAWVSATVRDRVEVEVVGSSAHARLQTLFGLSPDRQRLRGPALTVTDAGTARPEAVLAAPSHQPTEYDAQWLPVWSDTDDERPASARSVRTVALCAAVESALAGGTSAAIPSTPADAA
jgi:predicted dehydrogenase